MKITVIYFYFFKIKVIIVNKFTMLGKCNFVFISFYKKRKKKKIEVKYTL